MFIPIKSTCYNNEQIYAWEDLTIGAIYKIIGYGCYSLTQKDRTRMGIRLDRLGILTLLPDNNSSIPIKVWVSGSLVDVIASKVPSYKYIQPLEHITDDDETMVLKYRYAML